jgi:hypothetical protein
MSKTDNNPAHRLLFFWDDVNGVHVGPLNRLCLVVKAEDQTAQRLYFDVYQVPELLEDKPFKVRETQKSDWVAQWQAMEVGK